MLVAGGDKGATTGGTLFGAFRGWQEEGTLDSNG